MNQIAGLAAELLGKRLERRFKRLKIPLVDLCEFFMQSFQSRDRFRFIKNFLDRLGIEFVIFIEEVRRPFRNIFEELDLLLYDREHFAQIFVV